MGCFDFFLSLKWPKLYCDGANQNVVCHWIICQGAQDVFGAIGHSINDCEKALVVLCIPNLDNFVGSQTYKMAIFFVYIEMCH